ncbi:nSTAND1 domain-containing NTPase [Streptomyces sp. NPDC002740]
MLYLTATGRPLDELRGQAVRRPLESYALVIVDRFEELFTLCQEQSEREAFIEGLCRSAADGLPVVLGVRADFYGHCVAHPLFFAGNPGLQAGRAGMRSSARRREAEFSASLG